MGDIAWHLYHDSLNYNINISCDKKKKKKNMPFNNGPKKYFLGNDMSEKQKWALTTNI